MSLFSLLIAIANLRGNKIENIDDLNYRINSYQSSLENNNKRRLLNFIITNLYDEIRALKENRLEKNQKCKYIRDEILVKFEQLRKIRNLTF